MTDTGDVAHVPAAERVDLDGHPDDYALDVEDDLLDVYADPGEVVLEELGG